MGSIDVNVSAASALSVYSVSLDRAAITMDQDGEDEVVVVTFYGFDGSEVTSRADFTMSESSSSVIGLTRVGTSNRFIISAKNSGVAIVEFTTEDNPYIATRLRVEVGGSAVQGNTLRALHAPASSIGMKVGSSRTVTVNAIPYDAPVTLLWKTSDSSIANVTGVANSTSAIVNAIGEGSATITATSAENTAITVSFTVTVTDRTDTVDTTITHAIVTASDGSTGGKVLTNIGTGRTIALSAVAYNAEGPMGGELFNWSITSSNNEVTPIGKTEGSSSLTVLVNGYAKGNIPATVTATSISNPSVSSSYQILATTTPPTEEDPVYFVQMSAVTVTVGMSTDVPFSAYPSSAGGALSVVSSSDVLHTSVNSTSKTIHIEALRPGSAVIKLLRNGVAVADIMVLCIEEAQVIDHAIERVVLDRSYLSYDLATRQMQQITAAVYKNGVIDAAEKVVWSVDNDAIAQITELGNNIVSVSHGNVLGTAVITATSERNSNIAASCLVEVIDSSLSEKTIRGITLSSASIRLAEGQSTYLKASAVPSSVQGTVFMVELRCKCRHGRPERKGRGNRSR